MKRHKVFIVGYVVLARREGKNPLFYIGHLDPPTEPKGVLFNGTAPMSVGTIFSTHQKARAAILASKKWWSKEVDDEYLMRYDIVKLERP
jgi:hypothetical protein